MVNKLTRYVSDDVKNIDLQFGNIYVAKNIDKGKEDYVLFCSECGIEKFVFMKTGVVLIKNQFDETHKIIQHVKEVRFSN